VPEISFEMVGDRNNSFFHATTVARRRVNAIKAIQVGDDSWITDEVEIRRSFVQ
jgi:hypothetical protein